MDILTKHYGADDEEEEEPASPQQEKSALTASPPRDKPGTQPGAEKDAGSEDDDDDDNLAYRILAPPTSAVPPVSDAVMATVPYDTMTAPIHPSQRSLPFNPTFDQLWAPLVGPTHPHSRDGRALGLRNHRLGSVQDAAISPFTFDEQYHTFQAFGYSVDPAGETGGEVVGNSKAVKKLGAATTVYNISKTERQKLTAEEKAKRKKEKGEKGKKKKKKKKAKVGEAEGKPEEEAREGASAEAEIAGQAAGEPQGGVGAAAGRGGGVAGAGSAGLQGEEKLREKAIMPGEESESEEEEGSEEDESEDTSEEGEEDEEGKEKRKQAEKEEEEEEEEEDVPAEKLENPASEIWLLKNSRSPWAGRKEEPKAELTEEQKKYAEEHAAKKARRERGEKVEVEEKSTFHGKAEADYQGRSWIAPPKDAMNPLPPNHCYIPKRWIHTWSGHTKGVSAIRFFPRYGHLLLSASMDTKIKIWDVPGSKKCMRTYMGHAKAVRDISFSNDGLRFLSASYDRNIKLWDTESGKVISTFSTGKVPYVVRLHPDDDKQDTLLAGMSDKKIMQWDMRTGEITQEYDQHLGAVNTITFLDDNRRFVTSSDDKSLRVWEFGIPVVVKYISEPHMHSMPSISVHPNKSWLAAQSLDNQILVYGTRDRFRLNRKKRFAGHIIAGYACQVNFSPDGRFVMSGDGEGRLWFWDWKTCKVFRTLKCHDSVCIGVQWHPLETSRVATCGWDGLIKYWD